MNSKIKCVFVKFLKIHVNERTRVWSVGIVFTLKSDK